VNIGEAMVILPIAVGGWYMAWTISHRAIALQNELERVKRQKGTALTVLYIAEIKKKGSRKPETIQMHASSMSDAVSQLLEMKVNLSDVVSLDPATAPPPTPAIRRR